MSEESVGRGIAGLRKTRNLSQSELADMLNVTHQAVSKWERGESLPDVAILVPLASALGTSVDALLRGGAPSAVSSTRRLFRRTGVMDVPVPAAGVPVPARDDESSVEGGGRPSLQVLRELAPFAPAETVDRLVAGIEGGVDWDTMAELAPFMTPEGLSAAVGSISEPPSLEALEHLAAFLPARQLADFVRQQAADAWSRASILALAPFLEEDLLDRLVQQEIFEPLGWEDLAELAPHLPTDTVAVLLERLRA